MMTLCVTPHCKNLGAWEIPGCDHRFCDGCALDGRNVLLCPKCGPAKQAELTPELEASIRKRVEEYGGPSVLGALVGEIDRLRSLVAFEDCGVFKGRALPEQSRTP